MWINVQSGGVRVRDGGGLPLQAGALQARVQSPNKGGCISRQNSERSSTKSSRSNSTRRIQKKLAEHAFYKNTDEWQKEENYKLIRDRRKKVRKHIDDKLRRVRRLYIPSVASLLVGTIILFCSTLRSVGEGTFIWNEREVFCIVGPCVIVIGVILLLTAVGLESYNSNKLNADEIAQLTKTVIHPDFLKERQKNTKQSSKESSIDSYDQNAKDLDTRKLLRVDTSCSCQESALCSSLSSATSMTQSFLFDQTAKWAKEVAITFNDDIDEKPLIDKGNERSGQIKENGNGNNTAKFTV